MGLRELLINPGDVPVVITVEMLRDQLRDLPRWNEIMKQDLSDDEYADVIIKVIADFNAMPPMFSNFGPTNFPDRSMMIDWASAEALKKLYIWHARNQWSATDAGLSVPIHEQWEPLLRISEMLKNEAKERAKLLKTQFNIAGGWGAGVGSPLWLR